MIRRKRADTFVYRLYCDDCNTEMQAESNVLASNPNRFVHKCPNCQATKTIAGKRYPMIDYVEIEEQFADDAVPASPPAANS